MKVNILTKNPEITFDFKPINKSYVFGEPYGSRLSIRANVTGLRAACLINEDERAGYIEDGIHIHVCTQQQLRLGG